MVFDVHSVQRGRMTIVKARCLMAQYRHHPVALMQKDENARRREGEC